MHFHEPLSKRFNNTWSSWKELLVACSTNVLQPQLTSMMLTGLLITAPPCTVNTWRVTNCTYIFFDLFILPGVVYTVTCPIKQRLPSCQRYRRIPPSPSCELWSHPPARPPTTPDSNADYAISGSVSNTRGSSEHHGRRQFGRVSRRSKAPRRRRTRHRNRSGREACPVSYLFRVYLCRCPCCLSRPLSFLSIRCCCDK